MRRVLLVAVLGTIIQAPNRADPGRGRWFASTEKKTWPRAASFNRISFSPRALSLPLPPISKQPSAVSVKDATSARAPAAVPAPAVSELDMSKVRLFFLFFFVVVFLRGRKALRLSMEQKRDRLELASRLSCLFSLNLHHLASKNHHPKKKKHQTVLGIILGGGAGSRLYPLTKKRAKPAVPLGANYRLIDIPVSNCINSGVNKVYTLTQFNSASLNRHLAQAYNVNVGGYRSRGFVEVLAASQSVESKVSGRERRGEDSSFARARAPFF